MMRIGRSAMALSLMAFAAGCTQAPTAPPTLPGAAEMAPSSAAAGRLSYVARDVDFAKFRSVMVSPVQIYGGADTDWGGTAAPERQAIANYMQQAFTKAIAQQYKIVTRPGPNTLRVQFELVGIEPNVPVATTVSRVVPAGLVANIAAQATDQPGAFSGSVTYAVLVYDSVSDKLLGAAVNKKFPEALNIAATFTTGAAAKAGIDEGAAQIGRSIALMQAGKLRTGS
jgi:hypothetical protein